MKKIFTFKELNAIIFLFLIVLMFFVGLGTFLLDNREEGANKIFVIIFFVIIYTPFIIIAKYLYNYLKKNIKK